MSKEEYRLGRLLEEEEEDGKEEGLAGEEREKEYGLILKKRKSVLVIVFSTHELSPESSLSLFPPCVEEMMRRFLHLKSRRQTHQTIQNLLRRERRCWKENRENYMTN